MHKIQVVILTRMVKRIKIFVLHAEILQVRKQIIESLIQKLKTVKELHVDHEYVTDYDVDKIPLDKIKDFVQLGKNEAYPSYDQFLKNLHIKFVSNGLKHYSALTKASVLTSEYDYFMILEDDVLYSDDINHSLVALLEKQETWDIVMLGQPVNHDHQVLDKDKGVTLLDIKSQFNVMPCCDSYIIKNTSIKSVLTPFLPIKYQTNIHLSYLFESNPDLIVKSAWPNLFIDGTKFGVYISSIETNNRLFLNPQYNTVMKHIFTDPMNEKQIEEAIKSFPFKDHPDFKYLSGIFEIRRKKYNEAKAIFDDCYTIYEQNHNLLNGESEFMFNYMNLFKHFQDSGFAI